MFQVGSQSAELLMRKCWREQVSAMCIHWVFPQSLQGGFTAIITGGMLNVFRKICGVAQDFMLHNVFYSFTAHFSWSPFDYIKA